MLAGAAKENRAANLFRTPPAYTASMIIHTFTLRWKPEATQKDKDRALTDVLAFEGRIPGLLETFAGVNFSDRSRGHEFGAVMKFTDRPSLDAYMTHPLHQALLQWLVPIVDATDVDFEV
jgi:hypothetical protein